MGVNAKKFAKMKEAAAIMVRIAKGKFPITLEEYCKTRWSTINLDHKEMDFLKDWINDRDRFLFAIQHKGSYSVSQSVYKYLCDLRLETTKVKAKEWQKECAKLIRVDYKPKKDFFLSSYEWRTLRMKAIKLYGNTCQCCGASPKDGIVINVDHILPRKTHPELSLDINNLQILCNACNHGKGNWDSTDWRK